MSNTPTDITSLNYVLQNYNYYNKGPINGFYSFNQECTKAKVFTLSFTILSLVTPGPLKTRILSVLRGVPLLRS